MTSVKNCQSIKIKCKKTLYDKMIYYKRSQKNQWVFEIILRVATRSHHFWFTVSIISWNLYMCFWWQSLWKRGLLSCCLFPPRIKLTQFHNAIIPQLPYNRELRRQSNRAITGRNDISERHLSLRYLSCSLTVVSIFHFLLSFLNDDKTSIFVSLDE